MKLDFSELPDDDLTIIFAALLAMTRDIHSAQDGLSEEQWKRAEELSDQFTLEMNQRFCPDERESADVPLSPF